MDIKEPEKQEINIKQKKLDKKKSKKYLSIEKKDITSEVTTNPVWLCMKNNVVANSSKPSFFSKSQSSYVQSWPELPYPGFSNIESDGKIVQTEVYQHNENKKLHFPETSTKYDNKSNKAICATDGSTCTISNYNTIQNEICETKDLKISRSVVNRNKNANEMKSSIQSDEHENGQTGNMNSNNNGDDIKLMRWKRIQITEEKRRKKEEEFRRQLIAPKNQHIKIIDRSVKDLIDTVFGKNVNPKKSTNYYKLANVSNEFNLKESSFEFPDLSEGISKHRNALKSNNCDKSCINYCDKSSGNCDGENSNNIKCSDKSECDEQIHSVKVNDTSKIPQKEKKKKIKRNDPIEFNIFNTWEILQKRHKVMVSKKLQNRKSVKKKRLLSGNELDSDRPERKRGKYRENKKKKLTRIKKKIINERQVRLYLMNEAKLLLENNNKLILNNLDSNLFYHLNKRHEKQLINGSNIQIDLAVENNSTELNNCNKNNIADSNYSNIDPKLLIHSRKFRSYCNQWPNKEMNRSVHSLIKDVVKFQDRQHNIDPMKADSKRRYVCGFHEVYRFVKVNKAKLIIIATDIDCVEGKDSLLDYISQLVMMADNQSTPYVFCGSRWSLKMCLKKKCPISCVAVLNYDGAEKLYKIIMDLLPQVKQLYDEKLKAAELKCGITSKVEEDITSECIRSMLNTLTLNGDNKFSNNNNRSNSDGSGAYIDDEVGASSNSFMAAILRCSKKEK
ncbi:SECIS-binding protein 2 isoform X1 [Lycorma delicatula]|uniref:SECIS-binding protein 2 isoform X1 n=1 Tax=Lycorma delicatula TaxID=130591 RepID=UPI003F515C4F